MGWIRTAKYGSRKISDSALHTVRGNVIEILEDATFTTINERGITSPITVHNVAGVQPAGEFIYAKTKFTGLQLSAGVVRIGGIRCKRDASLLTDEDAIALINRMIADNDEPSEDQKLIIQTAIQYMKTAGVYSKLDIFYYRATHGENSSKQNWIKDAHHATYHDGYTFTAYSGVKGNGTTGYIRTHYTPESDAVNMQDNSASVGYSLETLGTTTARYPLGAFRTTNGWLNFLAYTTGFVRSYFNDSNYNEALVSHAVNHNYGWTVLDVAGNKYNKFYDNGTNVAPDRLLIIGATDGLVDNEVYELAANNGGATGFYNGEMIHSFYGAELNATEHLAISDVIDYLKANYESP